jgi:hypothetical protein
LTLLFKTKEWYNTFLHAKTYAERKEIARQTMATPFEVITVK